MAQIPQENSSISIHCLVMQESFNKYTWSTCTSQDHWLTLWLVWDNISWIDKSQRDLDQASLALNDFIHGCQTPWRKVNSMQLESNTFLFPLKHVLVHVSGLMSWHSWAFCGQGLPMYSVKSIYSHPILWGEWTARLLRFCFLSLLSVWSKG